MKNIDEIGLGKDILSLCGKCKMPMGHIIVSMSKDGKIEKCQCQTCKAVHKYKDPDAPKKKTRVSTKKPTISNEEKWRDAQTKTKSSAKPYKMTSNYSMDDVIEHPSFGRGVVLEVVGADKIKVIFEASEKLLICNRV